MRSGDVGPPTEITPLNYQPHEEDPDPTLDKILWLMDPDYCVLDIPDDPPEQTIPIHIDSDMPLQSQDYTETQFRSNNYSSEDTTPETGANRPSSSTDHSTPRERNENNATTNAPTEAEESRPSTSTNHPTTTGREEDTPTTSTSQ